MGFCDWWRRNRSSDVEQDIFHWRKKGWRMELMLVTDVGEGEREERRWCWMVLARKGWIWWSSLKMVTGRFGGAVWWRDAGVTIFVDQPANFGWLPVVFADFRRGFSAVWPGSPLVSLACGCRRCWWRERWKIGAVAAGVLSGFHGWETTLAKHFAGKSGRNCLPHFSSTDFSLNSPPLVHSLSLFLFSRSLFISLPLPLTIWFLSLNLLYFSYCFNDFIPICSSVLFLYRFLYVVLIDGKEKYVSLYGEYVNTSVYTMCVTE